ncbi:MAG: SDR family oxidoreductase [Ktedonobacterales bacterium]|nr:SDR family oxidoreductase [Ktedonobacterales bacterium]
MEGHVCLVTGANAGLGFVTAEALAARGARVILVGRDAARTQAAATRMRQRTGSQAIDVLLADLSAQARVRQLAQEVLERYDRLYVLVNNAGALFTTRQVTVDGLERTFALNHLAPFLLTNLLLERLRTSAPARIITVASAAHVGARIPFDDLQQERHRYRGLTVYGQSKLANILFTYELARRLAGTRLTANTLHPGFVATGFARNNGAAARIGMTLLRPIMIGPERGARTAIYLATAPEVADISGRYFANRKPTESSLASYDQDAARRLWEVSARLTGLETTI